MKTTSKKRTAVQNITTEWIHMTHAVYFKVDYLEDLVTMNPQQK
jgi:hypothetical protein